MLLSLVSVLGAIQKGAVQLRRPTTTLETLAMALKNTLTLTTHASLPMRLLPDDKIAGAEEIHN